jgi:hypothetical protein
LKTFVLILSKNSASVLCGDYERHQSVESFEN